ncbi:hypothetical protein ABK040_010427 [Willaertia magna]
MLSNLQNYCGSRRNFYENYKTIVEFNNNNIKQKSIMLDELWVNIALFLNDNELLNLALCCKELYELFFVGNLYLWKLKLLSLNIPNEIIESNNNLKLYKLFKEKCFYPLKDLKPIDLQYFIQSYRTTNDVLTQRISFLNEICYYINSTSLNNNKNHKKEEAEIQQQSSSPTTPTITSCEQVSVTSSTKEESNNSSITSTTTSTVEQEINKTLMETPDLSNQPIPDVYITPEELKQHDGNNATLPIWIGVKGLVFEVSEDKREFYAPGQGYSIFAGVDASRGLAKSSLNAEDLLPYGSLEGLTEKELQVLDNWVSFYKKRYVIVGKIQSQ